MAARVATRVATRALGGAYVALTPAQNQVAYSQVLAGTRRHTQTRAASALAANSRSFRTVLVATETYDEEMELGLDAAPSLGAGEGPAAEKQVKTYGPNARVTATGRILAIGDVHGDIQKLLDCLFVAGLIAQDADGIRWVGEDATVVHAAIREFLEETSYNQRSGRTLPPSPLECLGTDAAIAIPESPG